MSQVCPRDRFLLETTDLQLSQGIKFICQSSLKNITVYDLPQGCPLPPSSWPASASSLPGTSAISHAYFYALHQLTCSNEFFAQLLLYLSFLVSTFSYFLS